MPRSSEVSTRPMPKQACHSRLTKARAVVGDWRSTSQRARVRRVGSASGGSGWRNAGVPGVTRRPGECKSPRMNTCVSRGCGRGEKARVVVPAGHCFKSDSMRSLASFHSGVVERQ